MILIDRIIRILKKDIYLPYKCYANKRQLMNPRDCCACKNFCRKPPSGGTPVYIKILSINNVDPSRNRTFIEYTRGKINIKTTR